MPYNNFFLVAALKPRMNTDIYIYIYIYIYIDPHVCRLLSMPMDTAFWKHINVCIMSIYRHLYSLVVDVILLLFLLLLLLLIAAYGRYADVTPRQNARTALGADTKTARGGVAPPKHRILFLRVVGHSWSQCSRVSNSSSQ